MSPRRAFHRLPDGPHWSASTRADSQVMCLLTPVTLLLVVHTAQVVREVVDTAAVVCAVNAQPEAGRDAPPSFLVMCIAFNERSDPFQHVVLLFGISAGLVAMRRSLIRREQNSRSVSTVSDSLLDPIEWVRTESPEASRAFRNDSFWSNIA